ncbi:MAG: LLM class flavin-dependent oxidoreductase [Myxococcales bacterium]|nr:LLM class flavin-dependent oxidoreductase [Myxococcales bacterium]
MARVIELSVVEQSPVRQGGSGREALLETLELAERAEALGYRRFWVAEHHNLPSIASTSPEILIGQIAARTQNIRVGSGGVMLPHYSAFKVAENFRMLELLYPGRIDLGLGRAPGGDQRTAAALAHPGRIRDVRHYPEQVVDLMGFLEDTIDSAHPFHGLRPGPSSPTAPDVWLLGSGIDSAHLAAEIGLPFSYAHFFGTAGDRGPAIVESYRRHFRPSARLAEPRANIAVQVLCADTEAEAERHASSLRVARLNMARGRPTGLLSPEEASAHEFSSEELAFLERAPLTSVVGDPEQVHAGLQALADAYETNDVGVVTICYEFAARVRSYELVAKVCGLSPEA